MIFAELLRRAGQPPTPMCLNSEFIAWVHEASYLMCNDYGHTRRSSLACDDCFKTVYQHGILVADWTEVINLIPRYPTIGS